MSFWQEVYNNPVLQLEIGIIFIVFCFQIIFFLKTRLYCLTLESVFKHKLKIKQNTDTYTFYEDHNELSDIMPEDTTGSEYLNGFTKN